MILITQFMLQIQLMLPVRRVGDGMDFQTGLGMLKKFFHFLGLSMDQYPGKSKLLSLFSVRDGHEKMVNTHSA